MVGESPKGMRGIGRDRTTQASPLPRKPSEYEQLWQEIVQPWLWPSLIIGLLGWAIYEHGAETPLDTMLFTTLASLALVLALLDQNNLKALGRLRDWKWAAIGLAAVWLVMLLQLLPIPFLAGNTELWGRSGSVTVDPDLTIRAIVGMGSAVAFFVFGAMLGADRQRREIVLLVMALVMAFFIFHAFDSYYARAAVTELAEQRASLRMEGTFLNANTFAILMVMVFACGVGMLISEDRRLRGRERIWVRLLALLVALAAAGCVYLSMSRAALMLSFAILFGLTWLLMPARRGQISVIGIISLIVLLSVWSSAEQLGIPIRPLNLSQGLEGRFIDWQPGLDLTASRPILGWGAGTFARAMEPVREIPIEASALIVITPQNSILLITSETGLLGLAAWTVLGLGVLQFISNGLRHRSASPVLAAALLLGALAAIVQSLFDFPLSIPAIAAFWAFLLGYCGGLGGKSSRKRSSRGTGSTDNRSDDGAQRV